LSIQSTVSEQLLRAGAFALSRHSVVPAELPG